MTALIAIAAVMTAAAVAALAWPLVRRRAKPGAQRAEYDLAVYRDQLREIERDHERDLLDAAEAEAARVEVQRRMLAAADAAASDETPPPVPGRVLAGGLATLVAVAAFAIYFTLGSPGIPNYPFADRNIGSDIVAQGASPEHAEIAGMAAKLAARLKDNPKDLNGWVLLARTYDAIGEFGKAAASYKRALDLSGRRPDLVGLYGEALVRAADGQVTPEALSLFTDIAAAEPLNPQARYYLGLALAQQNRIHDALQAWVDLRALSPKDAPWLGVVNDQIGRAEAELKIAAGSVKPSAAAVALAKQQHPVAAAMPPGQPGPSAADVEAASKMSAGEQSEMIRTMVGRLAERMKSNPDDLAGWQRLAQAYRVLGETAKAADAQAHVDALMKRGAAAPARPSAQPMAPPGPSAADVEAAGRMSAGDRGQMIRSMVARLAERLKDNPDDLEGWRRLARSYQVLGETEKAREAQARVEELEKRR